MGYMFYIWIGIMVVAVVFEIITTDLTSFWFAIGAIAALVANVFLKDNLIAVQIAIFAVVSILSIVLLKPLIKKKFDKPALPTNSDALIGQSVYVVEKVTPNNPGAVKIEGVVWTAVSQQDEFEVGDLVVVSKIDGNKLIIDKGEEK